MTDAPAVSVIVPTRDRPDLLAACLAALERDPAPSFEVVVVDDASVDAAAVAHAVAAAPHARLVHGTGRGPAAARNLGARSARASLLAFLDDDCRPATAWLDQLVKGLARAPAVAGPTLTVRTSNARSVASQMITNHLMGSSRDPASSLLGFAPTSNLGCRAEVLRALPFDERYPLAAGEDRDWCARLETAGHDLLFVPSACVWHDQDLSWRAFWRQQVRYGRGAWRFHLRSARGTRWQPAHFYADLVGLGFRHGPRAGALVLAAQVAIATGTLREALATARATARRPGR